MKLDLTGFKRRALSGLPVNTSQAVCAVKLCLIDSKSHQLCRLVSRTWIDRGRFQPRDVNFRQFACGEVAET